jgi:hypothetical protein
MDICVNCHRKIHAKNGFHPEFLPVTKRPILSNFSRAQSLKSKQPEISNEIDVPKYPIGTSLGYAGLIECSNCHYEWDCESKTRKVRCPRCQKYNPHPKSLERDISRRQL